MKQDKPKSKKSSELRKKAEERLKTQIMSPEKISGAEIRNLIHELQVHQIELEMQNDELRKAQIMLEASHTKYSDLYDFAPIGYLTLDEKGTILEANLTAAEMLHKKRGILMNTSLYPQVNRDDRDRFYLHLKKVFEDKKSLSCELRFTGRSGKELCVYLSSIPWQDSEGNFTCRTSMIDITERKVADEELVKYRKHLEEMVESRTAKLKTVNEQLRQKIVERKEVEEEIKNVAKFPAESPYPVLRVAQDGTILYANASSAPFLHAWHSDVGQCVPDSLLQLVANAFSTRLIKSGIEITCRDQIYSFVIVPVADTDYVNLYGVDITERKRAEEKIKYLAFHDALTTIPNRTLFTDRLTRALAHAHRTRETLAVLFLDLDRFKIVNDTLGHSVGDLLLRDIAGRLKDCIREDDTVARFAGDEFTILLLGITQTEHIITLARKILHAVKQPCMIGKHELYITSSIGIALYPGDGEDAETLMKNADTAMYHAKEKGRNNYQFYTPSMHAKSLEKMVLESDLRRALDLEQFLVYYQPLVDINTGKVVSMEALVRWRHPDRGLILPDEFLSLSENTRLIVFIDELVLYTVCVQCKVWEDQGFQPLCVAVNLSAHTFQQPNLVEMITSVLQKTGLDAHFLGLEITEGIAMENIETTIHKLNTLNELGIQIAIDDFGTGFSSLYYLKKFPIHKLKISQHFVSGIMTDQNDQMIVTSIIALAQNLKFKVVAEGVETEDQLIFLKQRQCDEIQGYLFCKPLPAGCFKNDDWRVNIPNPNDSAR